MENGVRERRPVCATCQSPLGREAWVSVQLRHHHLSCLRCEACLESLGPGAEVASEGVRLFHPDCARRLSLDRHCGVLAAPKAPASASLFSLIPRPDKLL